MKDTDAFKMEKFDPTCRKLFSGPWLEVKTMCSTEGAAAVGAPSQSMVKLNKGHKRLQKPLQN